MYEILTHNKAIKYYESLNIIIIKKMNEAIDEIKINPFIGNNIKKLKGKLDGKYRYKLGDLRIVYRVNEGSKKVFIEAIGPRGDVYK